jgi:exosome complex RNA-binding protein Csl4
MSASSAVPGQRLGDASKVAAGAGTYLLGDHIYASVVGAVKIAPSAGVESKKVLRTARLFASPSILFLLPARGRGCAREASIDSPPAERHGHRQGVLWQPACASHQRELMLLLSQVTKVNTRFASVDILCIGTTLLKEPFGGMVR